MVTVAIHWTPPMRALSFAIALTFLAPAPAHAQDEDLLGKYASAKI
jgi:hypothetical protein